MAILRQDWEEYGCRQSARYTIRVFRVSDNPTLNGLPNLPSYLLSFGLSLEQRIEFLSRAIGNAKSTSGDGLRRFEADGEFLSDLEDKLDVATVQMEILARLARSIPRPDEDPHIFALGDRLMTISEVCAGAITMFNILTISGFSCIETMQIHLTCLI